MSRESLERLNTTLSICRDITSLNLPILHSDKIWSDQEIQKVFERIRLGQFSTTDKDAMAQVIVTHTPAYLHYGDDQEILKDVQQVLNNRECIMGA